MMKEKYKELELLFKNEIHDRASQIDEACTQDWFSLTLGWAIAKGLQPDDAHEFTNYILQVVINNYTFNKLTIKN